MKKRSILIVDDEEVIRASMSFDLRKQGYDVDSAGSGEEAFEKLAKTRYDLVISDIVMNEIDGIAVLKQAKALHPDTQIIMLTGYGSCETFAAAIKYEAFDYLLKPLNRDDLSLKIKRCMEIIELRETLKQREQSFALERKFIELLLKITMEANSSNLFEDTMQTCLQEVCRFMSWTVGHLYAVSNKDSSVILVPTKIWYLKGKASSQNFVEITEKTTFLPGVGLPGEVLITGKPKWITNIYESPNFPRAKSAKNLNVRAGFAFPVMIRKEVVGVIEFFSPEISDPDERILDIMAHIGIQMGRIFERLR